MFYGGEQLLPETKPIIEYVIKKKPNARYSLITNGYHIVDFIDILKNIVISNIMITILDGPKRKYIIKQNFEKWQWFIC